MGLVRMSVLTKIEIMKFVVVMETEIGLEQRFQ